MQRAAVQQESTTFRSLSFPPGADRAAKAASEDSLHDRDHVQDIDDVPAGVTGRTSHFFAHYKDLEPGRLPTVHGFGDRREADQILAEAVHDARRHDVYES